MESKDTCRIAILMTVHNRCQTTLECLRCISGMIYDHSRILLDIYLMDDGSTDGTADLIRDRFPEVHILTGNGDLFWNRGMHAAWKKAAESDYDFYWWVNDDTLVFRDTLSNLLDSSARHNDRALIAGSTCASQDEKTITYGGWRANRLITDVRKEQTCDTINGNLVLVPRDVYLKIGANDPYYRHSLGDTDYGLRARESGIPVILAPGILGICDLHERPALWKDPDQPFRKRWNHFFSPLGNNPFEYFHFRRIHFGILPAIGTFLSNFTHLFFPRLWTKTLRNA